MSHDNNSRLVYSTDGGMIKESAPTQSASPFPADGVVRIRRETGAPAQDPALIAACEQVAGRKFDTMWVGRV
mgnify:CR=1 FL=1